MSPSAGMERDADLELGVEMEFVRVDLLIGDERQGAQLRERIGHVLRSLQPYRQAIPIDLGEQAIAMRRFQQPVGQFAEDLIGAHLAQPRDAIEIGDPEQAETRCVFMPADIPLDHLEQMFAHRKGRHRMRYPKPMVERQKPALDDCDRVVDRCRSLSGESGEPAFEMRAGNHVAPEERQRCAGKKQREQDKSVARGPADRDGDYRRGQERPSVAPSGQCLAHLSSPSKRDGINASHPDGLQRRGLSLCDCRDRHGVEAGTPRPVHACFTRADSAPRMAME